MHSEPNFRCSITTCHLVVSIIEPGHSITYTTYGTWNTSHSILQPSDQNPAPAFRTLREVNVTPWGCKVGLHNENAKENQKK